MTNHRGVELDKPCPITPDEVLSLAKYYSVDLSEREEYYLLSAVKEAALAEVRYPWIETEDEKGILYYNQRCESRSLARTCTGSPSSSDPDGYTGPRRAAGGIHSTINFSNS